MLYPRSNKYRELFSLNGIWKFKPVSDDFIPVNESADCQLIPVPASFNEIVTDKNIKNHEGKFLYETTFSFPVNQNKLYRLRIGATSHKCEVYLNGEKIGTGINGYYPIDLALENLLEVNRLSVVIDNRLTFQCMPVGRFVNGKQVINHDFYNFTGIHRDVLIYSLPQNHIKDIVINTVVDNDYEKISVSVETTCKEVHYTVLNAEKQVVAQGESGDIIVKNPNLWSPESPYLYTLIVETECDKYEERFGIRKVQVTSDAFLLNDKPVYFKGFGLHEDFILSGKGNNSAVNIRNFELLKWTNANSFRTSHYPYSEEIMDLADEYGILVIDEVPAVCMKWWEGYNFGEDRVDEQTKVLHKELIKQLIERDKNHPSVVMYSLMNEPESAEEKAREYSLDVFDYTRKLTNLPLTFANCAYFGQCKCSDIPDVICINRYYGWYDYHANIDCISEHLGKEIADFHNTYNKPVFLTEFGADTIEGLHSLPSETFSEEFQLEILEETCNTLDKLPYCIGEHVWHLADFKTKQGLTRIRGNRKGVFTRDRQPKMSAHFLRRRWRDLNKF